MKYVMRDFYSMYTMTSIGWEDAKNRPIAQAERWMNARAEEGFRLTSLTSDNPRYVVVVMEKDGDVPSQSCAEGDR